MELLKTINETLEHLFGSDFTSRLPLFRVVWSNDQYEKRLMDVTDTGIALLTPEIREVPKYSQWVKDRHVLERLVLVPDQNLRELAGIKTSYEPLFVFQNAYNGSYLPPRIDACKFVIDSLYAAMGKKSMRKYVEPNAEESEELRQQRVAKIFEELYGNETDVGDALKYREGVFIPSKSGGYLNPPKETK